MPISYNQIAGKSVERLAALSDGIFAVAMTLLVLDLRVPAAEAIHSGRDLRQALLLLAPQVVMYMMTFITLGIFWVGQQTQLNFLERSHRSLAWIHMVFLFAVTLTPFSTRLLSEFIAYRTALLAYWLNILLLGGSLYFSWNCAKGARARQSGHARRRSRRDSATHHRRAIAVRIRRAALHFQHFLEHRIHRPGAALLRDFPSNFAPPGLAIGEIDPLRLGCYLGSVLIEARKQRVAGPDSEELRRPVRKVQQDLPPKLPLAVPPRQLGGLANTGPLSSGCGFYLESAQNGWSAIEERGGARFPTLRFYPCAFPSLMD